MNSVGAYFHEVTCRDAIVGKLDEEFEFVHDETEAGEALMYKLLKPLKPSDIIYDCTHDNPSPLLKFGTRRLALPQMGILALADQTIATTWGFDQLLPKNVSVVKEPRLYPIEGSTRAAWGEPLEGQQAVQIQPIEYIFWYNSGHSCKAVGVAGEFNGWQPGALPMQRIPNTNKW